MIVPLEACITAIHDSPTRAVVAVTGGGVAALQWLLSVPGASRTILEGLVPYAEASLHSLLGGPPPAGAASGETAAAMAEACLRRAAALDGSGQAPLVGVAATAALVSDRPKKGAHRAHVALAGPTGTAVWTITLDKGARDRVGEDAVVSELVVAALAVGCGTPPDTPIGATAADRLEPAWPSLAPTGGTP